MVDPIGIFIGFALFVVPGTLYFLVKRLSFFGIEQWWVGKQDKKERLNKVERTANGIKHAWEDSGSHPDAEERKIIVRKMDEYIDELEDHRRHERPTDVMKDTMSEIISDWRDYRDMIASTPVTNYHSMRALDFQDKANHLKSLIEQERKSLPQRFLNTAATRIKSTIRKVRKTLYKLRSKPLPYEVNKQLQLRLSDDRLHKFTDGSHYLLVINNSPDTAASVELISYDEEASDQQFNIYDVRHDYNHSPIAIDTLRGYTVTDEMLLTRLDGSEVVDTIPVQFFTPSGGGLKLFENEEPRFRHPDPREDDPENKDDIEKENHSEEN